MGLMKENEIAYIKERKITWKNTNRSRFDTKLFKEEEPEMYERYCKVSSSRLFKIK